MEIKYVEEKLGEWSQLFKPFIESEKFDNIYKKIKEDVKDGSKVFPLSENTFRAFKLCPPNSLKCIIYAQDPYPGQYWKTKFPHATGLVLDNNNSEDGKLQPSLSSFWEGIANEYSHSDTSYKTKDLSFLAEQGVLLLNRALTVIKDQIGSHQSLWDEFHKYLLEDILPKYPNVPVIFLGDEAKVLKKHLFELTHPFYELKHPSASARVGEVFPTKGVFTKVNRYLKSEKGVEIKWNFKPIAEDDEAPF